MNRNLKQRCQVALLTLLVVFGSADFLNSRAVAQESEATKSEPAKKYGVWESVKDDSGKNGICLLYTSPSPRDRG